MSKLTDILGLFKYDPETDGANTFNITQALNNNWDKIDAWASGIKSTIVGLVPGTRKVNGKALSEDLTLTGEDIKVSGSDETSISSSLSNKVGKQSLDIPNNDCNDIADFGLYRVKADTANGDTSTVGDLVINAPWDMNTMFQLLLSASAGKMLWRTKVNLLENPWSEWFPLANAMSAEEHAIVPKNGATLRAGFKNSYSKDQFGRVFCIFSFEFSSNPTSGVNLFSFPQGFIPDQTVDANANFFDYSGDAYSGEIIVSINGDVNLFYRIPSGRTMQNLFGFITF